MWFMPWVFRKRIGKGSLTLTGPDGFAETFSGSGSGPTVAIHVSDRTLDWKLLINPELRFVEAYMDGNIEVVEGELRDLLMLLLLNRRRGTSQHSSQGACMSASGTRRK